MSGLEAGRSSGTNVAMEPVRNPVIPPVCYGNQQLDLEDADCGYTGDPGPGAVRNGPPELGLQGSSCGNCRSRLPVS